MGIINYIDSLTLTELKELKKDINERIKAKSKKPTLSRADKIELVRSKLLEGATSYNYHELMYAFEIMCKDAGYPVTVNLKDDIMFVTKLFGTKPKEGFGLKHLLILGKYIDIYAKTYKTSDFPVPTLKGLGQSWIASKVIDLVEIDLKSVQVGEISDVEF